MTILLHNANENLRLITINSLIVRLMTITKINHPASLINVNFTVEISLITYCNVSLSLISSSLQKCF